MGDKVTLDAVLQSETLPTLPAVAAKILSVTESAETDLSEISDIISQDTALSTRLLKVVNSPFYGLWTPVGTIKKAVSILGITPVRSLVLSFSLLSVRAGKEDSFDYSRFWENSLAAAVTARRLMKELGAPDVEEGFTAGLLANVGEMLLARACPARYRWVLQAKGDGRPLEAVEREILGIDHCTVGIEIARRWRLPPPLEAAIGHHHAPEEYPGGEEDLRRLVRVVHLSGILADMFHSPAPQELKDLFIRRSRELLNLDENLFQSLAAGVHEEVRQAADSFGINVALQRSIDEILQEANLRLGEINLSYEQTKQELIRSQMELIQLNRALLGGTKGNLHGMAEIDDLTGAYNHRYLQSFLDAAAIRSSRYGHPLTLVLIDVDEFNSLNDAEAGDCVLKELYRLLRGVVRPSDVIARFGGDEFALVLPDTELDEGAEMAEKIRAMVAGLGFGSPEKELRITVSLGIACRRPGEYRPADLMQRAERALQEAGQAKNRVVIARGPGEESMP